MIESIFCVLYLTSEELENYMGNSISNFLNDCEKEKNKTVVLSWCTKPPVANCIKKRSKEAGNLQKGFALLINFFQFLCCYVPSCYDDYFICKESSQYFQSLKKAFSHNRRL